ncbi:WD repeat-containing protein 73-like [Liolophura sinensis]|uniref:WD repeat-containing protein 73-like n=1 Tax=Liolophura sinensis TaxID=3198878 RepID=UPI0031584FA9
MLSGGFSTEAVNEVKHIPDTRLVAMTKKETNGLSIWRLGDCTTDLIDECEKIENANHISKSATLDCSSDQVVFGSRLNDICLVDTSTNKVTGHSQNFLADDCLNKLFLLDDHVLLACCQKNCKVWRLDLREGLHKGECLYSRETTSTAITDQTCSYWTYDIEKSAGCISESSGVLSLGPGGNVVKVDLRNAKKSAFLVKLAGMTSCDSHEEECYGMLKTSPTHKDVVSVSGLDHSIHVYSFNNMVDGSVIQSHFTHDGHMACSNQSKTVTVTAHIWHPWQPDLILSSGSDGSLHAWQREGT